MCTEPSSSVSQSLPDEQQTEASEETSSKEQVTKIESLRNQKSDAENQIPEMKNWSEHFASKITGIVSTTKFHIFQRFARYKSVGGLQC